MSFSDDKIKQLKERLQWKRREKLFFEVKMNLEDIEALLARLEAAEELLGVLRLNPDNLAPKASTLGELWGAWRKAAGK